MSEFPSVPCNGCTLCCQGDAVRILPHEDASKWETVPHDRFVGQRMLAHRPNGDCVYLDRGALRQHGCTIQSDKPQMCYEMDCRNLAKGISWTQARKIEHFPMAVWKRGRELMKAKA